MHTTSGIGLRAFLPSVLTAAAGLAVGAPANAQDFTWKNGMSGGWPVVGNWDQGAAPNSLLPGASTLIARANAAVSMAANQSVYDLRINHATSSLTLTGGAALRFSGASPLGVRVEAGSLNLVQGQILKAAAGASAVSIVGAGKITAEGTSVIATDVALTRLAGSAALRPEFRVIGPGNGPAASVLVSGNITNAGLVSLEPRAVPGFNSASVTLELASGATTRTLTNQPGGLFQIVGGSGSRTFLGSLVNQADAITTVAGAVGFDNPAASYTTSGEFRLASGVSNSLTIRGARTAAGVYTRPTLTLTTGVIDAGATNGIGFGATRFIGDKIKFVYTAGEIVNGPIELRESELQFGDMCCVDSKLQITNGATRMLSDTIPMGVTVSVLGQGNLLASLDRPGNLKVQGRLILHSVTANTDFPRAKISMTPGPSTLTNEGEVYIGLPGASGVAASENVSMQAAQIVNKGLFVVAGDLRDTAVVGPGAQTAHFDNESGATFRLLDGKEFVLGRESNPAPLGFNTFTNKAGGKCEGNGKVWCWGSNGRKGKWVSETASKIAPGTTVNSPQDAEEFEPGALTLDADVDQQPGAVLEIAVAGPGSAGVEYSVLNVAGEAALGGILQISAADTSFLRWGSVMQIMNYASRIGDFDFLAAPSLAYPRLRWWAQPSSTAYRVGVRHEADVNHDGRVDIYDLNWVLSQYAMPGGTGPLHRLTGDANEDGVVNFLDLNIVVGMFGQSAP